jgi:hypothetical protein
MKVRQSTLPVIPGSTRNLLARGLSNNIACEMPNDPELVSGRHNNELLRSAQQDKATNGKRPKRSAPFPGHTTKNLQLKTAPNRSAIRG